MSQNRAPINQSIQPLEALPQAVVAHGRDLRPGNQARHDVSGQSEQKDSDQAQVVDPLLAVPLDTGVADRHVSLPGTASRLR